MTKKEYMKPELEVVKIQHQCRLLAGSEVPKSEDPVDEGWSPGMFDGSEWNALLGE